MTEYLITVDNTVYTTEADEIPVPPEEGGEWLLDDGLTIQLPMPHPLGDDADGVQAVEVLPTGWIDSAGIIVETSDDCQDPAGYRIDVVMTSGKTYTFYRKTEIPQPPLVNKLVLFDYATAIKLTADKKAWDFLKNRTTRFYLNTIQISEWNVSLMSVPPGCPQA